MKKLTLDLDKLAVETFDTDSAGGRRGTAFGHVFPSLADCGELFGAAQAQDTVQQVQPATDWTGMDTCYGGSCLQTCAINTCQSCTATQAA
jgi:hypothetical protein